MCSDSFRVSLIELIDWSLMGSVVVESPVSSPGPSHESLGSSPSHESIRLSPSHESLV